MPQMHSIFYTCNKYYLLVADIKKKKHDIVV